MSKHTIQIAHRTETIEEAVRLANLDLSYNRPLAMEKISGLDSEKKQGNIGEIFVAINGDSFEVLYVYKCDIQILNKLDLFVQCLDSNPFHPVSISSEFITIHADVKLPRTREARKSIANCELIVTTL